MFGSRYSKARYNWNPAFCKGFDTLNPVKSEGVQFSPRACHSKQGNHVHKTVRFFDYLSHSSLGRVWCGQENRVDVVLAGGFPKTVALFNWKVRDHESSNTGFLGRV